jgi:hypothetical protein
MSITKLKPIGGWATVQYSDPTLVGSYVRAQGTPLPTRAPRILVGLLTGGDDPLSPTYVASQKRTAFAVSAETTTAALVGGRRDRAG